MSMTRARQMVRQVFRARGLRLRGLLLLLGALVGCGPNLRATLTAPEQGSSSQAEACNVSGPWESNNRLRITATVVADCASTGPIHVLVRTEAGTPLAQADVAAVLKPDEPAELQTPAFDRPEQSYARIVVELSGACEKRTLSTSATCLLTKDPPVAGKDPPIAGEDPPIPSARPAASAPGPE